MAKGLVCDACGATAKFDSANGRESETGEESAWITLSADNVRDHHACTRECAKVVIDGDFGVLVTAYEQIAAIARMIREGKEEDEGA